MNEQLVLFCHLVRCLHQTAETFYEQEFSLCWAMDFMSDELFDGRRIRLLRIVDHFSRESIAVANAHPVPSEPLLA